MKKFKIYVVEDMAISRAALIDLLEESNYEIVGSAANADKAWEEMQHLEIDLALLDINLAGKNDGIWLAQKIRESLSMAIVFLTAYGDENTINKLSTLNPNGYLMKPYNKPTLITTITIALKAYTNAINDDKTPQHEEVYIIIEESSLKIKLNLNSIYYVISDGNYLDLHLKNKKYTIRDKLSSFLDNLPNKDILVQTHLRYAVNINKVTAININNLLIDENIIPISKSHKHKIFEIFYKK